MNIKTSLTLLILVLAIFKSGAQDSFDTNINVIPPSPNVVDFNKGVEFPISYYTGSANIEIPIYHLSLPQIDLPISLSYRASGLKVEDHASWVGAGWTLQAGGNISRTVKGLPDELNETTRAGWFASRSKNLFDSSGGIDFDEVFSCYSTETPFPLASPSDPLTRIDSIAYGWIDTEPDLFYFSTPAGGGKFIFDQDYNIKPLQEDDFTIYAPINLTGTGKWEVYGPDGTKYVFEDQESTTSYSECGRGMSAYNDPMTHVSAWQLSQIINAGDTVFFHYESESLLYGRKVTTTGRFATTTASNIPLSSCSNTITVGAQRLSAITTSYGDSISFIAEYADREDLEGSHALWAIDIYKDASRIKYYELDQDYFGTNNKLKLTKVEEKTTYGSETYPPYLFAYYEFGSFPSLSSTSQDYWGYYNGSTGGLLPTYKDQFNHVNRSSTANRKPSLQYAKVGTLKSIEYPTGGKVTFDYELHSYYDSDHSTTYFFEAEAIGVIGEATPTSELVTFTVAENCSATIDKNIQLNAIDNYVKLQKKVNGVFVETTLSATGNRRSLPAGEYALYAYNEDPNKEAYISIEYEQEVPANVSAGGLRIKSITEEDPVASSGTFREFEYENDNGQSSGVLFSPIKLGGKTTTYVDGELFSYCQDTDSEEYLELNAFSQVVTYSGSHIGYSNVTEKISAYSPFGIKPPGSGKIEYNYHNQSSTFSNTFPFIELVDLTHKNGKLLEKTIYGQSSAISYFPVQHEQYSYTEKTLNSDVTKGFMLSRLKSKFCFSCEEEDLDTDFSLVDYEYRSKWYQLDSKAVTKYHPSGDIIVTTTYTYDSNYDHLYPVSEEVEKSTGEEITTEYTRASSPALLLGVDRFQNTTQLSGIRRSLNGRLPTSISQWNKDITTPHGQYENISAIIYDNNRPIHHVARDGTETVYLWGYHDTYPVAQIAHAGLAEVQALLTSTYQGYLEEENPSDADLRSLFQHLRSNLPESQVSGYIYKPGFGLKEVVDPNGKKQSYDYDGFRRLKSIMDNDDKFLSSYQYLFQSQN
ncbi:hypothetical protein [Ekhidna sp. To15]|uniref:hypothetical protein n=1 Tax=Ekhidna sp. To15 TaxID=3395267 RepID=UPI003F524774